MSAFMRHPMTFVMLAIFVVMVGVAAGYPAGARFMPFVVGLPAIALCLLQVVLDARSGNGDTADSGSAPGGDVAAKYAMSSPLDSIPLEPRREVIVWGYFLGLVAVILFFGFWIAIPAFLVAFLRFEAKASWLKSIVMAAVAETVLFVMFAEVLRVELHRGFITQAIMDRLSAG